MGNIKQRLVFHNSVIQHSTNSRFRFRKEKNLEIIEKSIIIIYLYTEVTLTTHIQQQLYEGLKIC